MSLGLIIGPIGNPYTLQANPVGFNYLLYSRSSVYGSSGAFQLGLGALAFGYTVVSEAYRPPLSLSLSPLSFAFTLKTNALSYLTVRDAYLGLNTVPLSYFSSEAPFVNVLKQRTSNYSGTVWSTNQGGNSGLDLILDANGYPTSLIGRTNTYTAVSSGIFHGINNGAANPVPNLSTTALYPPGPYNFGVTFTGTVLFSGDVTSVSVVSGTATEGSSILQWNCTGTVVLQLTMGSGQGSGFTWAYSNFTTGYPLAEFCCQTSLYANYLAGQIGHPIWKAAFAFASALRPMKWLQTNGQLYQVNLTTAPATGTNIGATILTVYNGGSFQGGTQPTWPLQTGSYQWVFNDGEQVPVACTLGSATVTISSLTATQTSATCYALMQPTWASRALSTAATWATPQGVPVDVLIALANEMGIDLELPLPVNANAQYIANVAALCATGTDTILEQINAPGIAGNLYIHGATGTAPSGQAAGNPAKGVFGLISEQTSTDTSGGFFQTNPWNAGQYTGFTPIDPSTAQFSYAASGQSTTAQYENGTVGAYLQSIDRPSDPSDSKMMITPEIDFLGLPIFTTPSSVLSVSLNLQIPTATNTPGGKSDVYCSVNHIFTGPGGILVNLDSTVFHLNESVPTTITTSQDIPTGTYIVDAFLGLAISSPYLTTLSGVWTPNPWSGYNNLSWTISTAQFQNALNLLAAAYPAYFNAGNGTLSPANWLLTDLHLNAEFHFTPVTDDCTLGWSMQGWSVTLNEGTAQGGLVGKLYPSLDSENWNAGSYFGHAYSVIQGTANSASWPTAPSYMQGPMWYGTQTGAIATAMNAAYSGNTSRYCVIAGIQFAWSSAGPPPVGNGPYYASAFMNTPYASAAAYTKGIGAVSFAPYINVGGIGTADITRLLAVGSLSAQLNEWFSLAYTNVGVSGNTYSSMASTGWLGSTLAQAQGLISALNYAGPGDSPPYGAGNAVWGPAGTSPVLILGYESGTQWQNENSSLQTMLYSALRDARMQYVYKDPGHVLSSNPGYYPALAAMGFAHLAYFASVGVLQSNSTCQAMENVMQTVTPPILLGLQSYAV